MSLVPAIVEVGAALDVVPSRVAQIITPDELAAGDATALGVIHILDEGGAEVGRGGTGFDEAVLGVPDVSPIAVSSHVTVGVVGEGGGVGGDGGVLVEGVGGVEVGEAVFDGLLAVADGVVGEVGSMPWKNRTIWVPCRGKTANSTSMPWNFLRRNEKRRLP